MSKLAIPLFFVLVIFGVVMLASAGVTEGQRTFDDPSYYWLHQLWYGVLPGLIVFFVASKIDYHRWKKLSLPLFIVALVLLVLVFAPGIGVNIKGAHRWINLGFATVQPSEFIKLALVAYLAAWFARHKTGGVVPFFLVLGITAVLLVFQPDFGTLGIVMLIGIAMYYFSGVPLRRIAMLLSIVAILGGIMAVAAPYRFDRIKTFLNPDQDTQNTSYHINQALISIGSGGILGVGYGQGKQKTGALPEPVGDSIFAVLAEELGMVGGVTLLLVFVALAISLASIARHASDPFARLFVLGIAVWISGQAFINIAAISGIIPLTGVPLPLISYGSSSMVSIMAGMGIVKNITSVDK